MIINHERNLGLSSARNSGINHSNSDYIIFIDSDIVISKNWVHSMYESIREHKDIIGVTGDMGSKSKKISSLDHYLLENLEDQKYKNRHP